MGDRLNTLIMKRVFGYTITRHTPLTCELSGIGSGLGQFTYANTPWISAVEHITGKLWPETYVWGTGFIEYGITNSFYRKKMRFAAVRGKLSQQCAEAILGEKISCVLGDGGILSDQLLVRKPRKIYNCGIVAHYKEQNHLAFAEVAGQIPKSIMIDVRSDPIEVIQDIAKCECIISSSLHALVVADSLGIPNIHLEVSDAMLGDGFKYDDYYSSFGVVHRPWKYYPGMRVNLDDVYRGYLILPSMTDFQKSEMIRAFPF